MDKFIRVEEVMNITSLEKSTIYEGMRDGWFPRPVQIGPRAVGWVLKEIQEWQQECLSKRGSAYRAGYAHPENESII